MDTPRLKQLKPFMDELNDFFPFFSNEVWRPEFKSGAEDLDGWLQDSALVR